MTNPSSRYFVASILPAMRARIMQTKGAFGKIIFLDGMVVGA